MKLVISKNIGFCSGVRRALVMAEKSLEKDPKPIQFLGEIVHNKEVEKRLRKKGGIFISNIKKTKPGALIIRAHGIAPFKQIKNAIIRDATCPLVRRVQKKAQSLFEKGYQVIIIGSKNHPEVKGVKGYTKNKALVVESESQARKIPKFKKIGVVAQTTQNINNVKQILKILKDKSKEINYINTLCPEVQARQKELGSLLKKVDGVLVIGSQSSANTKQLVKIAQKSKKLIKDVKNFSGNNLGLVSGTSTPDWEIKNIVKTLK